MNMHVCQPVSQHKSAILNAHDVPVCTSTDQRYQQLQHVHVQINKKLYLLFLFFLLLNQ